MSKQVLHTKFGIARINKGGYYQITSTKEGNKGKLLHRIFWEHFYNFEVPKGYEIHHKNGNKSDNCILNLQLVNQYEHRSAHKRKENHPLYGRKHTLESRKKMSDALKGKNHPLYGKSHSLEQKLRMSKSRNKTGIFRVSKCRCKECKNGFTWTYRYYDENGKPKTISSVDLKILEQKVLELGLEWIVYELKED